MDDIITEQLLLKNGFVKTSENKEAAIVKYGLDKSDDTDEYSIRLTDYRMFKGREWFCEVATGAFDVEVKIQTVKQFSKLMEFAKINFQLK